MASVEQFLHDLDVYIATVNSRRDEIPLAFKNSIIRQIHATKSIDTRRFVNAVDFRETEITDDNFRYEISSFRNEDVTYDGFVEVDGDKRNWVGRFNYRDGIQNTDLKPVSDSYADSSFAR